MKKGNTDDSIRAVSCWQTRLKAMVLGRVAWAAVSCATAQPKQPTVAVYSMDQVIMKTSKAVFAFWLAVPAREVPAMMMDQQPRRVPPPMRDLRRGSTSETETATQLDRNWRVDEMAVRPKALVWPMSSK